MPKRERVEKERERKGEVITHNTTRREVIYESNDGKGRSAKNEEKKGQKHDEPMMRRKQKRGRMGGEGANK